MAVSDATLLAISTLSVGTPVADASDFTAMTPAEVAAKFELASYGGDEGSAIYAPGADGDYDVLDPDLPPVTDLGLWAVGAFVNQLPGSLVGGSLPAFFHAANIQNETFTYGREILGLPAFRVQGESSAAGGYNPQLYSASKTFSAGAVISTTHFAVVNSADAAQQALLVSVPSWAASAVDLTLDGKVDLIQEIMAPDTQCALYYSLAQTLTQLGDAIDIDLGPAQMVQAAVPPPVLALSSAATTTKLAAITQREVAVWKPFVVLVEATTGEDPGANQVFYSLSRSADELIEIYRATSTAQITLKVRSGGVDYTDALGAVTDNTAFSVAINVFASFTAASLDGGTVQVLTAPKPSGVLTLESIGCKHDGTQQCNGPIAECTLIHPAVWTAAQLEA
jgi:hypothetical protein